MGRRHVAIIGNVTIILGQVICGAARQMDMFIGELFYLTTKKRQQKQQKQQRL